MKTYIKYIYLALFLLFVITANAQSKVVWVWKDVQKFQSIDIVGSPNLTLNSLGYPSWVISKGVQTENGDVVVSGNIVSHGYPYWTISKDVQKNSRQRRAVKPATPMKEPVIASISFFNKRIIK